jgi:hypothetical protein
MKALELALERLDRQRPSPVFAKACLRTSAHELDVDHAQLEGLRLTAASSGPREAEQRRPAAIRLARSRIRAS